jgi:hypothetical protein
MAIKKIQVQERVEFKNDGSRRKNVLGDYKIPQRFSLSWILRFHKAFRSTVGKGKEHRDGYFEFARQILSKKML